ncbi:MAG: 23S rRNA pseudouridine1911/1915/1917 synthase [Chlamydiales bacterium]|jgi:23S rRNA pseudouridine1911/1915/1917 synthase
MASLEVQKHTVPAELAGERVDRVLAQLVPALSRTRLQALVADGHVLVNGEPELRRNATVASGALIEIEFQPPKEPTRRPDSEELNVLYSDDDIIVIDKQAGVITHRTQRGLGGTVADLAVEMFGPLPSVQGADRPGIVHRLDRLTTGVMVLGRTEDALENLKAQFKERTVQKTYRALAHGDPRFDSEWIELRIAPLQGHFDRYRALPAGDPAGPTDPEALAEDSKAPDGRAASTYYEVIERFRGFVSLKCMPKTGRTHQIRVHLFWTGLPIVGDRQYGPRGGIKHPLPPEAPAMSRQALHAQTLEFTHPTSGERLTFDAPIPKDMSALETWLQANRTIE